MVSLSHLQHCFHIEIQSPVCPIVGSRGQTDRLKTFSQTVEIMNQHNFYGYKQRIVKRKTQNAASVLFQLQFEVIVLAV